jgi:cytochrome c
MNRLTHVGFVIALLVVATSAVQAQTAKVPADIQKLLEKNTCLACHHPTNRLVGPPYSEVAKRKYTPERIVELIYKPNPANWPDYPVPMAALPNVPKDEALAIGKWINTLAGKATKAKKK